MLELEEVRLQNNRIRTIDTLTFSSNPKLRRIILHSNQIETIARNSFDSLDGLEMLILTNNSLTVIGRAAKKVPIRKYFCRKRNVRWDEGT